jgi:hypothetical protein
MPVGIPDQPQAPRLGMRLLQPTSYLPAAFGQKLVVVLLQPHQFLGCQSQVMPVIAGRVHSARGDRVVHQLLQFFLGAAEAHHAWPIGALDGFGLLSGQRAPFTDQAQAR